MKRMKIAMVVPELVTGGAETMAVRLACAIDKTKFHLKVICLGKNLNGALDKELSDKNIEIIYLGEQTHKDIITFLKLSKQLSLFQPDIIHGHIAATLYALPWIMFHKCKILHTVHTRPDMEFSRKVQKIIEFFAKHKKLIVCAVSKENQYIASSFYKLSLNQVEFVNNPVDINRFRKESMCDGLFRLINVSRQDSNKNQILLLEAIRDICTVCPKIQLILVGDGNQHNTLIRFVKENNLDKYVLFTGEISNVADYLAISDLYLSASHREALPLSIIEAMASKLPIVASRVGGIQDLIDGNGFLYEDNDLEELKKYIVYFYSHHDDAKKMGERSFELVQEFDVSKCVEKYQAIYLKYGRC